MAKKKVVQTQSTSSSSITLFCFIKIDCCCERLNVFFLWKHELCKLIISHNRAQWWVHGIIVSNVQMEGRSRPPICSSKLTTIKIRWNDKIFYCLLIIINEPQNIFPIHFDAYSCSRARTLIIYSSFFLFVGVCSCLCKCHQINFFFD